MCGNLGTQIGKPKYSKISTQYNLKNPGKSLKGNKQINQSKESHRSSSQLVCELLPLTPLSLSHCDQSWVTSLPTVMTVTEFQMIHTNSLGCLPPLPRLHEIMQAGHSQRNEFQRDSRSAFREMGPNTHTQNTQNFYFQNVLERAFQGKGAFQA